MEMIDVKLQLPKEIIKAVEAPDTQLETVLWQKIVLALYREETISFGKAAELLGMTKWDFTDLLRGLIPDLPSVLQKARQKAFRINERVFKRLKKQA
jgi:predicted HTH domain antitoxin